MGMALNGRKEGQLLFHIAQVSSRNENPPPLSLQPL